MLERLAKESALTDQSVREMLVNLTADQLNWRPDSETWSIGQQFDHMLLANRSYIKIIEELGRTAGPRSKEYKPGYFGRFIMKVAGPDSTSNVPVPKAMIPSDLTQDPVLMKEYLDVQRRFDAAILGLTNKDLNGKFSSPFAKIIRLKLGDAVQITVLHNQRHVRRALANLTRSGFPNP